MSDNASPYSQYKSDTKEYRHAYYVANKERISKQNRANEPKYKAQKAAYAKAHKEQAGLSYAKWFAMNPKKRNEWATRWQKNNREKYKGIKRKAMLKANYGIAPEQFDAMAASQGFACAICKIVPNKTLHVDHDHKTGRVRGLLCAQCNSAIGLLKENTEFLARAISYLSI